MRIVVKLGTSSVTAGTKKLHAPSLLRFAQEIAQLRALGHEVILVSSGAVAAGREVLQQPTLAKHLPAKQMLAAVGQPRLMHRYSELFGYFDIAVAQVLLTKADIEDRKRYLNARDTLNAMLAHQVLPIINENDAVSTAEIRVGDNDQLSALVANLIQADKLILVTDCAGLFDKNPREFADANLITDIPGPISAAQWQSAGGSSSGLGTGGMTTKLQAAEMARNIGCEVLIVDASEPNVLQRALAGTLACTRFHALADPKESKKRFLRTQSLQGALHIDAGAAVALGAGKSLLAVGVVKIVGEFDRGAMVQVIDASVELARGLVRYSSAELSQIAGTQSKDIHAQLGFSLGNAVIHRNDLLVER